MFLTILKKLFLGLLFFQAWVTQAQVWKPTSASITFKIKHALGATADGSFKGLVGTVVFDPKELSNATIKASIDAKTIDTDLKIRDKNLRSEEYFDVEKYPKITMVSQKFEKGAKENDYVGTFSLTLKKTTKVIKIPFSFVQNGTTAQMKSTFQLNRVDYEIGEKSSLLGDVATISITLNVQQ